MYLFTAVLLLVSMFLSVASFAHENFHTNLLSEKSIQDNHDQPYVLVGKGQRSDIDVLSLCKEILESCIGTELSIKRQPSEGVLFQHESEGTWSYQHAGTSVKPDEFEVLRIGPESSKFSFSVAVKVDSVVAKIELHEPADGSVTYGGKILISYSAVGGGFDHIHLQLNEENHVSVYLNEGQYEFAGLENGTYVVSATLARSDHKTISGSRQSVTVKVLD